MKVLLVTGKLAEKLVRKYGGNADVFVADTDVAAFITPKHLEKLDLSKYDLVLVPGLTRGNRWDEFEEKVGTKVRLGPIHAYDLQYVMKFIDKIEFSHFEPACKLIEGVKMEETLRLVDSLDKDYKFKIKNVPVGGNSRMKVVAEVARFGSVDELLEKIDYYTKSGADIVDIGIPLEFESDFIRKAIKVAVDNSKLPVSVDTFNEKAIKIAVECGVDMIMSISKDNLKALDFIRDQAVVVVDRNIQNLKKLVEIVGKRVDKVIADPVLDPPMKVAESICRYMEYRKLDSETPVLFGAGNVTELSDADSIGINALLAFIAEELQCNLLFTTEASVKTTGSVRELKLASYLAKAAKIRNSPPKDAGISLLVLKEKVRYEGQSLPETFVEAKENKEFIRDPLGDFIIYVADGKIVCKHEKLTIVGENAKEIVDTVLKYNLVSRLDHAAYLGRELKKAEIAAVLKKNYIQDRELNFGYYTK